MKIYVSKSGQHYGPYSIEELRTEIIRGVFQPENFATTDRGEQWGPISALPGLGPLSYLVESRSAENILLLSYRGKVTAAAAQECAREIETALTNLRPGFRLLSDFTGLESMELACAIHIERVMDLCNQHGIRSVVRVIPNPKTDIGLGIMSHFHYRPDVQITTCTARPEADEILRQTSDGPAN